MEGMLQSTLNVQLTGTQLTSGGHWRAMRQRTLLSELWETPLPVMHRPRNRTNLKGYNVWTVQSRYTKQYSVMLLLMHREKHTLSDFSQFSFKRHKRNCLMNYKSNYENWQEPSLYQSLTELQSKFCHVKICLNGKPIKLNHFGGSVEVTVIPCLKHAELKETSFQTRQNLNFVDTLKTCSS